MSNLILASNRLPVTIHAEEGDARLESSPGGLATGLSTLRSDPRTTWLGWPGLPLSSLAEPRRSEIAMRLRDERLVPVELHEAEVALYYDGVSNGMLWPLLHSLLGDLPLRTTGWDEYTAVNERFAERIAAVHRRGDVVWVHDYHLMLLPAALRRRLPEARIGFFLHVPFPSSDVFRVAPHREELLRGVLGADLVGFHTAGYVRHFASSAIRLLGADAAIDRLRVDGRDVRLGVFPMGVDAARFAATASRADVVDEAQRLRGADGCRLLVGLDRLDYTKGIPRRLLAYEQLLARWPELRGRVRLLQVAVPTRASTTAYQDFRGQVDGIVGRINGAYGTPTWTPVHYLHRTLDEREIVAMYRAADVMLVTPIRDGMNLVAKEFCASRVDGDGVLVVSEMAGAAADLAEALHVNPYDVDGMAAVFKRALDLPPEERRARMGGLRDRVATHDAARWATRFLDELRGVEPAPTPSAPAPVDHALPDALERASRAEALVVLLDYDGTLVPFAETPERAAPDEELLALLRALGTRTRTQVHLVSGRPASVLDAWFGELPLTLHAEHGAASRAPTAKAWRRRQVSLPHRERLRALLDHYAERTPGAFVEEKATTLAWHWRKSEGAFGDRQAADLRLHLAELTSDAPIEVILGEKVLEVRRNDVHKGRVVEDVLASAHQDAAIVAAGDDRTDEDMFARLPDGAIAIHVGPRASAAAHRVVDHGELRRLLAAFFGDLRSAK